MFIRSLPASELLRAGSNKCLDFDLCSPLPFSLVRQIHGFIVGQRVGVLGSFGLKDKVGGIRRQGGVQEVREVSEVSISLGAVKANVVDGFACAV